MSLAKAVQGARHTGQEITWTRADGAAQNLAGATLSGTIQPSGGVSRAIAGTLTVTDAANGVFTWGYAAADVQTAGYHLVQFKATYGGTYDLTFTELWQVEAAL